MKKTRKLIFSIGIIWLYASSVWATSLDELYRDVVRSDNMGYLPLFVKNRKEPDIAVDDALDKVDAETFVLKVNGETKEVKLTNEARKKAALRKAKQIKWEQALKAVAENRVSPLDLEEINQRVKLNDAKAVEVLAWMYTKGVGVKQNLVEAFKLYKKAESLQVSSAAQNASLVFKAMTADEKAKIKD